MSFKALKTLAIVWGGAFLLNLIWENFHSLLYVHYRHNAITEAILVRASFADAFIILGAVVLFGFIKNNYWRDALFVSSLLAFAIYLERWALATDRWQYTIAMPIIPWLNTGLTPTIQLALLGSLAWHVARRYEKEN